MIEKTSMKKLIVVLLFIVAVLVGYIAWKEIGWSRPAPVVNSVPTKPAPTPEPSPSPTTPTTPTTPDGTAPSETPPPAPVLVADLPPIDATWQTFTKADGSFTFQYPMKGAFAPTWEQTYVPWGDTSLKAGCHMTEAPVDSYKTFTVDGHTVCQSTATTIAPGSSHRTDFAVVTIDTRYLLITFTKQYANPDAFDDARYQATLEQIISTFKVK